MTTRAEIEALIKNMTGPMRAALLAGAGDDVRAGAGTWFKLRAAGLVDGQFYLTGLGAEVRARLSSMKDDANG